MTDKYVLEGGEPAPEPDLLRWGQWMQAADRQVKLTEQEDKRVSTVFLGLDYSSGDGPPLLFETMVFVNDTSEHCQRYSTRAKAEAGHARWVKRIFTSARTRV